jgi:hypothetical protein
MPVKSLIPREVKEDGIELDGHFLRYIHYITYFSKIKGIIIYTLGHKLGTTKYEMENIFYITLFSC